MILKLNLSDIGAYVCPVCKFHTNNVDRYINHECNDKGKYGIYTPR